MKRKLELAFRNPVFQLVMQLMFAYLTFMAVIIATLQTPPEAILDGNLKQVMLVFEEFDE